MPPTLTEIALLAGVACLLVLSACSDQAYVSPGSDPKGANYAADSSVGDSAPDSGPPFDGFSTGWYIVDSDDPYDTQSDPNHAVTDYGDPDGYWYEPSGAHGMIGSADPVADFANLRSYVIGRAGAPTPVSGPLTFTSDSTIPTFTEASFSYILCDFWLDASDDPSRYQISSGTVDDGIEVVVNDAILGQISLNGSGSWPLDNAVPGTVNTLIVILMDNSQYNKYVNDLAFYRDGVMVSG